MKKGLSILLAVSILVGACDSKTEKIVTASVSEENEQEVNGEEEFSFHLIGEVINKHGNISKLGNLNAFVKNVKNNEKAQIDVISYGIEGQRVVDTLTFKLGNIHFVRRAEGKFIQDFICENIDIEEKDQETQYVLKNCSGSFNGDVVILSSSAVR
ncbi:DUF4362 domain-containing protein [Bacillus sp. RO3]|nr:DUF4362 domain-containing protein [Bacillus sp. RO3]